MLKQSQPIFAVRDVKAAIAYYRNVLGFESEWLWDTPPNFGGVNWGEMHVMFCLQPAIAANIESHQHYFTCDDIEALHAKHVAAGAEIISPIGNKPWGLREYTVRDLNGYHLRFGGPLKYERPATALATMPGYIQIVERKPTPDEYTAVHEAVGWGKSADPADIIDRSLTAFVAIDTRDGKVIGITRVVRDAVKWHSIWDVMVRPEYQAQRIGTAMVESAVNRIRELAPGSVVHLFTMKQGFYDRIGFKTETVTTLRL